jgi:hypothetical protein
LLPHGQQLLDLANLCLARVPFENADERIRDTERARRRKSVEPGSERVGHRLERGALTARELHRRLR